MSDADRIERAIILSAGKGSRLLPLTADRPKCLLDLSGRTLLDWQLTALAEAGIGEVIVVTGFRPDLVEEAIERRDGGPERVSTVYNPFYHVADNLGSVWMARSHFDRDCLLLNGDTLIEPAIVARLIDAPEAPIVVTVDEKPTYDEDDMKVLRDGARLVRIGKTLAAGGFDAESIGLLRFTGEGRRDFIHAVERIMDSAEGTSQFYLRVIDRLADTGIVFTVPVDGRQWQEVDYPADLEAARRLTERWRERALNRPARAEPAA